MVGRLGVEEGHDEVNIISVKWLLALFALILAAGAVVAQDLSAGKTSAQLFNSDCSACHHLPNGLGKKYNTGSLTDFLQAHYTTKTDSAGALARYLMGFAPLRAAPVTTPSAEEGVEGTKARGRASNLSSDGEKPLLPWPQSSEEPPKPAAAIGQPDPTEATDPMARIRAYAVSGASPRRRRPNRRIRLPANLTAATTMMRSRRPLQALPLRQQSGHRQRIPTPCHRLRRYRRSLPRLQHLGAPFLVVDGGRAVCPRGACDD
jgi:hypothetical protein